MGGHLLFEVDWLSGWIRKDCPLVGGRVGGFVEIKDQPGLIRRITAEPI